MQLKHLFFLLTLLPSVVFSQAPFFKTYSDSVNLVNDGRSIVSDFMKMVKNADSSIVVKPSAILNTTPYLIYWDDSLQTANLPIWSQVIEPQKEFFYSLNGGSKEDGVKMFGLFFNGFYLPHELAHCVEWNLFKKGHRKNDGLYRSEYFANTMAIIYWRLKGRQNDLAACYAFARKVLAQLPNPVPKGVNVEEYFNTNYQALSSDPYKYGFFQFNQFVEIYEKKELPSFSEALKAIVK